MRDKGGKQMRKSRKLVKQFCAVSLAAVMGFSLMGVWGGSAQAEERTETNVAYGIVPTARWLDGSEMTDGLDGEMDSNSAPRATNGVYTDFYRYGENMEEGGEAKPSYAQFDLKKNYDISSIKMWRYYEDGREYTPTAIAVSESSDDWSDGNVDVIYNSDTDGIFGLGEGSDTGYAETADGKEFICGDTVTGRYVRVYSLGSNVNTGNHIAEFEVYGNVHTQVPGKASVIFPEGEYEVILEDGSESPMDFGSSYSFQVKAADGYYVSFVTANGTVLEAQDGVYTIEDVQEDQYMEVQILPYPDMENLALRKEVTVHKTSDDSEADKSLDRTEKMAVDGIIPAGTADSNYCDFGKDTKNPSEVYSAYLQIDMKGCFELAEINLYRYWNDGRTYNGTVIASGETEEDFKNGNCKILYNSDKENYHGFGEGSDETYVETEAGYKIDLKERFPEEKIEARFIRIYMHGSSSGSTNHIVECQVMGYDFGEKPYEAEAFDNSGNYIDLPTHYDRYYPNDPNAAVEKHIAGQVTHPDVVKVEEGFGGHKYWMFYTPNVMLTSQFENPYIVYSDDGINWEEPIGDDGDTVNPIAARVTGPTEADSHNCDTDLVYDSENKRMLAYWNWSNDVGADDCQVRMMVSYDGIHWGAPTGEGQEVEEGEYVIAVRDTETRYNLLSPSVTYDSYKEMYFMYYNNAGDIGYTNGQNNKVQVRWSKDGINWSEEARDVENFLSKDEYGEQLAPWHQDVQYIPSKNEYWALSQCFAGNSPDNSVLYMTRSKDGLHWEQVGNQPVLTPNDAPFWNDFQIYRSTFLYDPETDTMDIWYSALQTTPADRKVADPEGNLTLIAGTDDSRIWRIGHTSNKMTEVMKALTQNEFYEEPAMIASRGFMLTADDPVLEEGETTDVTTKWSVEGGWGGGGDAAPDNTVSDMNIRYRSDNEAAATVDPWGRITAHEEGQAIISGTTMEGSQTEILIEVGNPEDAEPRQEISAENPLYIANYYWSDGAPTENINNCDAGQYPERNYISDTLNEDGTRTDRDDPLKLWNTIPDDLKDNTVILLIAERSIKDNVIEEGTEDVNAIRTWYKKQVEFCNKNKIPCAVQNLNGETSTYDRIPLSFWKELAEENEYLVGFNGAELYNRFNGGVDNNGDEYMSDLIRMGASMGVSMMWTDTNVFGNHGVLMDWLEEEDSVLGNAMKDNHEYVSMMYKESYGNPSTDALYLGLWLTGYCDNWGVASDWWHWQLDGNGTMFDEPGSVGGWGQTLVWPENMYSQDIIRVASMGAASYKSEPQWYSVASNGDRTPAYQYSVMPTLQKLCSGEINIPTREEVAERTKLVVKGTENFSATIYDESYSQLYPKTGQYGIVPLVPNTVDNETLKEMGFEYIVEEPLTEEMLQEVYPEEKYSGNAWAENWGDTWYMMNSSEDKDVRQSATVETKIGNLTVDMTPHTYAVAVSRSDSMVDLILSNYRLDKSELWNGTNPAENMSLVYQYIWEMSRRMQNNEGRDTELRETVITVESEEKPEITFKNNGENLYAYDNYTRPFEYSEVTGEPGNWTVTVRHNGFVECSISTSKTTVVEVEDFDGNVTEMVYELGAPFGTLPKIEIPDGYEFIGWKDQDGNAVTTETIVREGMRLIPEFKEKPTEPTDPEEPNEPTDPEDSEGQGSGGISDKPETGGDNNGADTAVKTGDTTSAAGIAAVMITTLAALGVALVQRKKIK